MCDNSLILESHMVNQHFPSLPAILNFSLLFMHFVYIANNMDPDKTAEQVGFSVCF